MRGTLRLPSLGLVALLALAAAGCASVSGVRPRGLEAAGGRVDLARFMGAWAVIAHLPTGAEEDAHHAVERYALREDGDIDVRFTFCETFGGEERVISMRGWVHDPRTNAEWRVRPFWPLALDYQILELDPRYRWTVVGHPSGRYAWVMAREPGLLSPDRLDAIRTRLAERGYATDRWRLVPHDGPACEADRSGGEGGRGPRLTPPGRASAGASRAGRW